MQKREQGKQGGSAGGAATPAPKRGRPFGSGTNSAAVAAVAAAADSAAPSTLLGPTLQVHSSFAGLYLHPIFLKICYGFWLMLLENYVKSWVFFFLVIRK